MIWIFEGRKQFTKEECIDLLNRDGADLIGGGKCFGFDDVLLKNFAFFARMHHYMPGWKIPEMRPDLFTNLDGFIIDYWELQ